MYYVLLDSSTANLIESFDSAEEAIASFKRIIDRDPEAVDDVVLMAHDAAGDPTDDEPISGHDVMRPGFRPFVR